MKIRCLLGHQWRDVPKFKPRTYQDDIPEKVCLRCFKEKYQQYVLRIRTIEGPGWRYYIGPQWEGQSPPDGLDTWAEYWKRIDKARDELIRRAR